MDIDAVLVRVDEILVQEFELDPDAIVPAARLQEDLDLDSLDGLDLVVAIEKEFDVRLDEKKLMELKTVAQVHQFLRDAFAAAHDAAAS